MLSEKTGAAGRTLLLAGGGLRQLYTAAALAEKYRVYLAGAEDGTLPAGVTDAAALKGAADALVLPMPVPPDTEAGQLSALLERLKPGGCVLGGRIPQAVRGIAEKAGFSVCDYAAEESFILRNAVPTAEGAISIAMQALPETVSGMRCLILGGGRVSAALQTRLSALGAEVTAAARSRADRARAEARGVRAVPLAQLDELLPAYSLIINTIPALILTEPLLAEIRRDALVMDLASKPGGVGVGDRNRAGTDCTEKNGSIQ